MGKFLMACAMIMITLFPFVQFSLNQVNHHHITRSIEIVNRHAQIARTEGYFTGGNILSLKTELADLNDVSEDEIIVNAVTTPKYRFNEFDEREMINYEVLVPVNRIMAMGNYFDISDAQNRTMYPIKGSVPSEVLAP